MKSKLLLGLFSISVLHLFSQTIAAGKEHSLSICNDNTVRVWGLNNWGQLGNGQTGNGVNIIKTLPVQVNSLTNVIKIAGGYAHSIALKNDGTVWTWGNNEYGQLGVGDTSNRTTPVQVVALSGIIKVASGLNHCLALKDDGTVWSWGRNNDGNLGNANTIEQHTPVQVNSITGIIDIAAGCWNSVALKNDGTVWAWGTSLGNGIGSNMSSIPVQVSLLSNVTAISCGYGHSLALKSDSTVWAWGYNMDGQIGDSTITMEEYIPVKVWGLNRISKIACGYNHSIALKSDGSVWSWGRNIDGQLGYDSIPNSSSWYYGIIPLQINGLSGITAIAAGERHTLALKSDGTMMSWGDNTHGQLGNGGYYTNNSTPNNVLSLCPVSDGIINSSIPILAELHPNPTNGIFTISTENLKMKSATIYNVLGEKVYTSEIKLSTSEIDLTNQPNGIYFVNIRTEQGIVSKKIIINK